jgi:hypothetical protein
MVRICEHALSTVVKLTVESRDERLRFDAARWLVAQYEKREELEQKRHVPGEGVMEVNRDAIIEELKGLYRRALPEHVKEPPLVELVAAEGAPDDASAPKLP